MSRLRVELTRACDGPQTTIRIWQRVGRKVFRSGDCAGDYIDHRLDAPHEARQLASALRTALPGETWELLLDEMLRDRERGR